MFHIFKRTKERFICILICNGDNCSECLRSQSNEKFKNLKILLNNQVFFLGGWGGV